MGLCLVSFLLFAQTAYSQDKEERLKVISFNTWFGMDGHGLLRMGEHESAQQKEKRYQGLVAGLREYDPDIVFLQEANPLPAYARRLAHDVEMDAIYAVNNAGVRVGPIGVPTNLRTGLVILAKPELKLKKVGAFRTSGRGIVTNFICVHFSDVRIVLEGTVFPNGKPLHLFCIHAHAAPPDTPSCRKKLETIFETENIDPDRREDYLGRLTAEFDRTQQDILRSIPRIEKQTTEGEPYIVAGDLNAYLPDFPAIREFENGLHLIDSFAVFNPDDPGYTWDPGKNPQTRYDGAPTWVNGDPKNPLDGLEADFAGTVPMRIDYIFLSDYFAAEDVLTSSLAFAKTRADVFVSDHFGVMTEITMK